MKVGQQYGGIALLAYSETSSHGSILQALAGGGRSQDRWDKIRTIAEARGTRAFARGPACLAVSLTIALDAPSSGT